MSLIFNYLSITENMTAGVTTFSLMVRLPSSFLITHMIFPVLATLSFTNVTSLQTFAKRKIANRTSEDVEAF